MLLLPSAVPGLAAPPPATLVPVVSIYWSDGDSGRLNGEGFRLANVDAPETGGTGTRGGARCAAEQALGYRAKAYMVELTRTAVLRVVTYYGTDRYGRHVVDLTADGQRVDQLALAEDHLAPWPHRGHRALAKKPQWCRRARSVD